MATQSCASPRGSSTTPGIFLNTVGDISLLPVFLDAARRFDQAAGDLSLTELQARLSGLDFVPLLV
jgi:hypothetical protein